MRTLLQNLKAALGIGAFAAAGLAAPALAQEAEGEPAPGTAYVADVFTDWEIRCIRAAEEGQPERCEMFQLLRDEEDSPVAVVRINIPLAPAEGQVATAVIVTPLEALLTPGIRLRVDDSEPAGVPYTLCEPSGCLSQIPLNQGNIDAFRAGGDIFLDIFALVRGDLGEVGGIQVPLTASLRGFTAAFDDLQARHEPFAALVAEQRAASEAEAEVEE